MTDFKNAQSDGQWSKKAQWSRSVLLALCLTTVSIAHVQAGQVVKTLKGKNAPGILLEELLGVAKDVLPQGVDLRKVFQPGIELTKKWEGWVPKRYNDAVGYCTVGYGHLLPKKPPKKNCDGTGNEVEFLKGISKKRGEELLIEDMAKAQITVQLAVPKDIDEGAYAALVDFAFNVGGNNFKNSTLLAVVKKKQFDRVPEQFLRWTRAAGVELKGLKKRRQDEIKMFFDGKPVPKPAPIPGEDLSPLNIDVVAEKAPN
ncbi:MULTISPECIES: lysozyme [unclassified Mesorhizobium]|uniref:lysozyme n=1 Tax=unclassified Mesorhizobium TaxID=325217 RepID=UPI00112BE36F|nr:MULTISPECIES: lysozyme [unclassified Mesorhizobium]MBZ9700530.1 lysozyme [Mesorhizobium sp. CO1-1-3]MBZ9946466.1 lysozyme [Mesorhizobium sp. BR1-1-11]TPI96542.1 lysozyme [Mesorhizobium sp. B2-8-1]